MIETAIIFTGWQAQHKVTKMDVKFTCGRFFRSTSKFLSYFDLVVKEDRSLLRGNRNISRPTRVQSPTLAFPPPLLEHTVKFNNSLTKKASLYKNPKMDIKFMTVLQLPIVFKSMH